MFIIHFAKTKDRWCIDDNGTIANTKDKSHARDDRIKSWKFTPHWKFRAFIRYDNLHHLAEQVPAFELERNHLILEPLTHKNGKYRWFVTSLYDPSTSSGQGPKVLVSVYQVKYIRFL